MTYIAFIDDASIVTKIVRSPDDGQDWATTWSEAHGCLCLETCKDGSLRKRYAQPGYTYRADLDAFIGPSPYPSWVLDEATADWVAPVAEPSVPFEGGIAYLWDEANLTWVRTELLEDEAALD